MSSNYQRCDESGWSAREQLHHFVTSLCISIWRDHHSRSCDKTAVEAKFKNAMKDTGDRTANHCRRFCVQLVSSEDRYRQFMEESERNLFQECCEVPRCSQARDRPQIGLAESKTSEGRWRRCPVVEAVREALAPQAVPCS